MRLLVTPVATVFRVAVAIEPAQKGANAAARQGNTGIGSSVIEIDRVAVGGHRVATRKDDILDIAMTLILRLCGFTRARRPSTMTYLL
jgi:hypothetical protein